MWAEAVGEDVNRRKICSIYWSMLSVCYEYRVRFATSKGRSSNEWSEISLSEKGKFFRNDCEFPYRSWKQGWSNFGKGCWTYTVCWVMGRMMTWRIEFSTEKGPYETRSLWEQFALNCTLHLRLHQSQDCLDWSVKPDRSEHLMFHYPTFMEERKRLSEALNVHIKSHNHQTENTKGRGEIDGSRK